jgi:hypothetical protein
VVRLLAFAILASACTGPVNGPRPDLVGDLDEAGFRKCVEPILARDCSYLACHGNAGFAFRVYSIGKLRLGDSSTLDLRTAPLTSDERHANFLSAEALSYPAVAPADDLLLRKPLPSRDGGYEHKGGAIFTGHDDPRAQAILAWLSGDDPCAVSRRAR